MFSIKRIFYIIVIALLFIKTNKAQTILNTTQTVPVDETKRDLNSIKLQSGFKYGAGTSGSRLTLQVNNYQSYVESNYIDVSLNCNQTSFPSGTTPNISLVGELNGKLDVTPMGQANYNIPIFITPGTANMQPVISLSYLSNAGMSIAGEGFNISGMSVITRISKNLHFDNIHAAVQLNNTDAFVIDGTRMILTSGNNAENGSTYSPNLVDFSLITAQGNQGFGPEKFTVVKKDNTTIEYGGNTASRLIGVGDNTVMSWFISKVTDEFGNYMNFHYKQLSGEVVIDYIEYTGNDNAGLLPYAKVSFEYVNRTEKNKFYIAGKEFNNTQLLKSITCDYEGQLVKKYALNYIFENKTLLNTVTEINKDGTELISTSFCWEDPSSLANSANMQGAIYPSNSNLYSQITKLIPADLNGDGFSDVISIRNSQVDYIKNDYINFYGGSQNAVPFTTAWTNSLPNSNFTFESTINFDENFDNKQETYLIQSNASTKQYSILKISEAGISTFGNFTTTNSFTSGENPCKFHFDINDYTGDGVNEKVIIDPEKITVTKGTTNFILNFNNTQTLATPIDFNGDGTLEFILYKTNTTSVDVSIVNFTGTGTGFSTLISQTIAFSGANSSNNLLKHIGVGDFNGDGKTDLYILDRLKQNFYIKHSNGLTYLPQQQVTNFTALTTNTNYDIACPDFNADGYSDIIITDSPSSTITNYQTYYSVGNNLIKGITTNLNHVQRTVDHFEYIGIYTYHSSRYEDYFAFSADFNGDGKYDILSTDPSSPSIIIGNALSAKKRSLIRIKTGLKKQIDIKYINTASKINRLKEEIYADATNTYSGDLASVNPRLFVVDKVRFGVFGGGSSIRTDLQYFYKGAILNKKGLGFLGFESYGSFDQNTNIGSETNTIINPVNLLPQSTTIKTGIYNFVSASGRGVIQNSELATKTQNNYITYNLSSKKYFLAIDNQTYTDNVNITAYNKTYTYDLSKQGYISVISTNYGWAGQPLISTTTENNYYTYVNNRWRNNVNTVTNTQIGETPYSRTTAYSFDSNGHLTSIIKDPTFSTQSLVTIYENFNDFGIPTKSTISANDILPRTSEVIYDSKGRFKIQAKNTLLQTESFVYEPLYGNLVQSTDIESKTSTYKYDGIGRLIETKLPNNTINKVEFIYDADGSTQYSPNLYKQKIQNEGQATSYVYFDAYSRETRKLTTDALGNTVITTNVYNLNGELNYTTEPHFENQQSFLATQYIKFDLYNRLTKTQTVKITIPPNNPTSPIFINTGIYTNYKYNAVIQPTSTYYKGFTEISDNSNKAVRKEYNGAGQNDVTKNKKPSETNIGLIETTQIATTQFNSNGQPKNIVLTNTQNANSITHSFLYNDLGFKTQFIDPSAGTINYTYNTLGQVLTQIDANSNWTFKYDALGRMFQKTGLESGTTTHDFVTVGDGLNKIKKITSPNVITEYEYDILSRNTKVTETIGAKTFVTETVLDKYGKTLEYKFPNGYITKNNYNDNGFLTTIKDVANNLIWQLDAINNAGQITQYSYGNGIQTNVAYDYLHQLNTIEHGSLHKQVYDFDALTGNLNSRDYFNYSGTQSSRNYEKFTFDGLDRLKKFDKQNPLDNYESVYENNTSYDVLGNITHKDDAGDFKYLNQAKPFNLTQIDNPTPNIPTNQLNILYNDLKKVKQITEAATTKEMNFVYGNDGERIQVDYLIGGVNQYTRYYQNSYEREEKPNGDYTERTYIYSPTGLTAIYYKQNTTTGELLYVLNDHLGSPLLLTDNAQNIVEQYSFDAWGRRRNPDNWLDYINNISYNYINRGFTFHEHIDEFGLINMNGRVYDPVLGRFIQPDNYIQAPDNLQNFNRYAYVLNNPLKYNDPSGEFIGAIIGGFTGFFAGYMIGVNRTDNFGKRLLYGFAGAGIGVGAGFVGGLVGAQFSNVIIGAILGGATAGAISGAGYTALSGGDASDIAENAAIGSISGAIGGGLNAGIGGGWGALAGGLGAGATAAALSGAEGKEVLQSALISGAIAYGMYELALYHQYSKSNSKLNFMGYNRQQGALQRYNNWGKRFEVGGYYTKGGGVSGIKKGKFFGGDNTVDLGARPENAIGEWHTHTVTGKGLNSAGPRDIAHWYNETASPDYFMDVYGADGKTYSYTKQQINSLGTKVINSMGTWNNGKFEHSFTELEYGNFSQQHGLNTPSGSYSTFNTFGSPFYLNFDY